MQGRSCEDGGRVVATGCLGRTELGLNGQSLRNWVSAYREAHAGEEPPLSVSERARLWKLEKEVRELRLENEFLGKSAAFFAREYR
ncbi:MAG: transposase [Pseudonocardiaceae bacterium]